MALSLADPFTAAAAAADQSHQSRLERKLATLGWYYVTLQIGIQLSENDQNNAAMAWIHPKGSMLSFQQLDSLHYGVPSHTHTHKLGPK